MTISALPHKPRWIRSLHRRSQGRITTPSRILHKMQNQKIQLKINRLIKDKENKHMKLKYTYTLFTLIMVLYFVPVNAQKTTKAKKATTKTTTVKKTAKP